MGGGSFSGARLWLCGLLLLLIAPFAFQAGDAQAQGAVSISDVTATLQFPDSITFKARIESKSKLERVVLEYGVEKLTCGTVVAKAFPTFDPNSAPADVTWTWEMRKSGSEPPGSRIWYRWSVTDAVGASTISEKKTLLWLDSENKWESLSRDKITFHWYEGSRAFAQDLLDSASASLARLGETTGIPLVAPVDMYIYADTEDMKNAVLYEPSWTGGQAFPASSVVIIGINSEQVEWGKKTEAHELTHLLVGHLTFSCLGSIPTWLNEGIAVYGEGGPDDSTKARLQSAIKDDTVISVRALSGGFSEHPDKADLSYAQSYSLVDYLVSKFGRDKMLKLFGNLRDGIKIEDALLDAYGFDLDGLEDGWRLAVGAKARRASGVEPSPTAAPTPVPTYRPSSSAPLAPPTGTTPEPETTVISRGVSLAADPTSPSKPQGRSLVLGIVIAAVGALLFTIIVLYVRRRMRSATS